MKQLEKFKYIFVGSSFFLILYLCFQMTILEKTDVNSIYPYKMKIYFSKTDGLKEGQDVYLLGTLFGVIREISKVDAKIVPDKRLLEQGKEHAIEIIISVKEPITLWDNYQIKFKSKTAFSGRSLDIDPGTNEGFSADTKSNIQNGKIQSPTGKYYDDFFAAANNTIKENDIEIRRTIINLREISTKLNGKKGSLPLFINSDTAYIFIDDTFFDAGITLKEFRRLQESSREGDIVFIPFSIILYRQLFDSLNYY